MAPETATDRRLVPTVIQPHGDLEIHLFGRPCGLGRIMDDETRESLAQYAWSLNITDLFAVNGQEFNGVVVLPTYRNFPDHSQHRFDGSEKGGTLRFSYGVLADGVVFGRAEGYVLRSGDCHTVVLTDGRVHAAVHAGRESVLGKSWRQDGVGAKPSVIENALRCFRNPGSVFARIVCGIGPESFIHDPSHPTHGTNNAVLVREVMNRWGIDCFINTSLGVSLSMRALIRAQLIGQGVPESHIEWDDIDTSSNPALWPSQSRGDKDRSVVLVTHSPR